MKQVTFGMLYRTNIQKNDSNWTCIAVNAQHTFERWKFLANAKQPEKLEVITRMPPPVGTNPEHIYHFRKAIADQGITVTDAVRNVRRSNTFGSYGGVRESLSTRGYRGVPSWKMECVWTLTSVQLRPLPEMQGVESVQVIKVRPQSLTRDWKWPSRSSGVVKCGD